MFKAMFTALSRLEMYARTKLKKTEPPKVEPVKYVKDAGFKPNRMSQQKLRKRARWNIK